MIKQAACRVILTAMILVFAGVAAMAAPYAAHVIDARTGQVLYSVNADTRLYPASLTKMMTLYITFEAIKNGEITLETKVTISKNAAAEPPSKLGLRAGQKIALKYLIRAAAVKSANDAATAIGEAVGGSEAAFARRMNKTAKALGMNRSTFKNANGLTLAGHMSTARDMTTIGRHLFYDFPEYYNLFSRISTDAGMRKVYNTNRKFLAAYDGADGIKTGYTAAAGFNLVSSAKRGHKRIIAAIFGGRSTAMRNEKMADLLDIGFKRAKTNVTEDPPNLPRYVGKPTLLVASAVTRSPRPRARAIRDPAENEQLMKVIGAAVAKAVKEETSKEQIAALAKSKDAAQAPAQDGAKTNAQVVADATERPQHRSDEPKIVARVSSSNARLWGIHLGAFNNRNAAEKMLLKTAMMDFTALDGARRQVELRGGKFHANFVGMTETLANRACSRLRASRRLCLPEGPKG